MKIETKNKRRVYIFLSIILWFLLSIMFYALIEKAYINSLLSENLLFYSSTDDLFLSPCLLVTFLISGIVLGYIVGTRWWQIVYVEKRHRRFKK